MNNVKIIARKLQSINKKCYIVGGFCRDYFISEKQADNNSVGKADLLSLQEQVENFYNNYINGDID